MTRRRIDLVKLRGALRHASRGSLLILAQRAAELVPQAKLRELFGDMVRLEDLSEATPESELLDEVRRFYAESMRGEFYESFKVNSKNCMQNSEGTDAFVAEFHRLLRLCIRAAQRGSWARTREALELLFELLRHIDEDPDSVIFFADEGGSWQVGVNWNSVLPVYFRCLAESASAEGFAQQVKQAISNLGNHERPQHLAAAHRVASAEQRNALAHLAPRERRP